jgi:hypothetical protein
MGKPQADLVRAGRRVAGVRDDENSVIAPVDIALAWDAKARPCAITSGCGAPNGRSGLNDRRGVKPYGVGGTMLQMIGP